MLLSAEGEGEGWTGLPCLVGGSALWNLMGKTGRPGAWGVGGLSSPPCPLEDSCFKTHADGFQTSRHQGSFLEPLSALMVTVRTGVNLPSHSSPAPPSCLYLKQVLAYYLLVRPEHTHTHTK